MPLSATSSGSCATRCSRAIGRWLRAAGYDVAIAEDGACDDDLLAQARAESRLPLPCDRRLGARAGEDIAIAVLASESLDEAARELSVRLGVDRLHAPFSRCLVDNTCLAPARATTSRGPRLRRGEVPAPHP